MARTIILIKKVSDTKAAVHLDPDEKLILPIDVIYKFSLRKNDVLDDEIYEELSAAAVELEIQNAALRYLGIRPHTVRELEIKLRQKKFPIEKISVVLQKLTEQKFLNDEEFARIYIVHAFFDKRQGANKIISALQKKGIDYRVTKRIIEEVTTPEDRSSPLEELAQKKLAQLKKRGYTEKELSQKLITFLLGRGFDYEAIKGVARRIATSEEE